MCNNNCKTVYTIGRISAYEQALQNRPVYKLGKRPDDNPPYDGGWVWVSVTKAQEFIDIYLETCFQDLNWKAKDFGVYELELPTNFEIDVGQLIHSESQAHLLVNDALIINKIT